MDFLSLLFGIVSNSIASVAIMIAGLILIGLAFGIGGVKISEQRSKTLYFFGVMFFLIGFLLTTLVSLFQIRDSFSIDILAILGNVARKVFQFVSAPIFILVLVIIALSILLFRWLRNKLTEWGYKIKTTPVIRFRTVDDNYRMANILVENIGKGKITCAAKLAKVKIKFPDEKETQDVDVNILNPYGRFLKWESRNSGSNYAILSEGIPNTIELMISYREHYTYGNKMIFWFADDSSTQPIPFGDYTITIDFLRWNGVRYLKLSTFEETIRISDEIEWLEKEMKEKPKEKRLINPKKKRKTPPKKIP